MEGEFLELQVNEERLKSSNIDHWNNFLLKFKEFCLYRYATCVNYTPLEQDQWVNQNKDWLNENCQGKENLIHLFLDTNASEQQINAALFCIQSLICLMQQIITQEEFVIICKSSISLDYEKISKMIKNKKET